MDWANISQIKKKKWTAGGRIVCRCEPVEVAGFGRLAFYGKQLGQQTGFAKSYERASGSKEAREDLFAIHLEDDPTLKSLYTNAEKEDTYHRDQNVSEYLRPLSYII